ncbi:MAG: AGE family epimerase/isomerase [Bacteroidales bacterium]
MDFSALSVQYRDELNNNVLPFWLKNSQDKEFGGYFSCLDRKGKVYDTDKFMWMQGRQMWLFSMLYNNFDRNQEWLDCALLGAEFMKKHGHDGSLNWYFAVTREGKPLVEPYNIFSHVFACMSFAQLSKATGSKEYGDIAKKTFDIILARTANPKDKWSKSHPGTRDLKNFALPMTLCNLSLEIEHLLEEQFIKETMETCLHEVMDNFYRPELGIVVENITPDNKLSDTFEGRVINPGHSIEAMWFVMDLGVRLNRPDIVAKAVDITIKMIEYGWDEKYGGIFYFRDRLGHPLQQLEWDQKLWWVHIESLISLIKGYQLTGSKECLKWFRTIHDYTWEHFRDNEYPEWFGYLNRQGEVLIPLKGGKWKGCFHVPRGLYQIWQILGKVR